MHALPRLFRTPVGPLLGPRMQCLLTYAIAAACGLGGLTMAAVATAMPEIFWQARLASGVYAVLSLLFAYGVYVAAWRARQALGEPLHPTRSPV